MAEYCQLRNCGIPKVWAKCISLALHWDVRVAEVGGGKRKIRSKTASASQQSEQASGISALECTSLHCQDRACTIAHWTALYTIAFPCTDRCTSGAQTCTLQSTIAKCQSGPYCTIARPLLWGQRMVFRKFRREPNLLSHSAEVMRVDGERIEAKGQIVIRPESSFSESGMTKFKSPY